MQLVRHEEEHGCCCCFHASIVDLQCHVSSGVGQSDVVIHTHTYIYIYICV